MKKINTLFITVLILSLITMSCVSTKSETQSSLIADPTVDLSNAEIYNVNPKVVKEGTLMSISGAGFGNNPGVVNIGGVDVTEYLGWDDNFIWFNVPKGIQQEAEVQVGYEFSDSLIITAPENSVTVKWIIDANKTQDIIDNTFTKYGLNKAPQLKAPLHVKGQWSKGDETYGLKDEGWDGGSRQVMFNIPGTSQWVMEAVFTPEAIDSFGKSMMLFAIEDREDELRNLSQFESDYAFIIKKTWAASLGLSNDPGVKINKENSLITIQFPVE
ncbi:MAG: hypothetical protein JXR64_10135 [Spirochaetales bacterium]|nr:hypothetical protein [Spirochaetales bacterium]